MTRLLVVDDEAINLEIIGEYLEGEPYELTLAADGDEAWDALDREPDRYDCVLLDRMMPKLNGIEVLKRVRRDKRMQALPVILQTAAAAPEQIAEGVRLGAYYYLSKPFDREILVSIVRAALYFRREQIEMASRLKDKHAALNLLTEGSFEFATLDEARSLAAALANQCENAEAVSVGLSELMVNAVEHGNLDIGYAEKSSLLLKSAWETEINRRLALPQYAARRARVRLERRSTELALTITDCGAGFDWREYLEISAKRAFDIHGRGIALARQLAFASLEYSGCGNTVTVTAPVAAVVCTQPCPSECPRPCLP
jgi:CheY-like chemotaxis protein